jgi:UDP-N-acetylmuramyl pentapeptide phosphotransferase/UDP-N-acetylglucosamine-1-phosphate transferase
VTGAAFWLLAAPALVLTAAAATAAALVALRPLLQRIAMAKPNARSSHRIPTPQGGGAAVVAVTVLLGGAAALLVLPDDGGSDRLAVVLAAAALLAVVGAIDDIRTLPALPRLLVQVIAVGIMVAALPSDSPLVPGLPSWLERAALVLAGVWVVNLVNFMDGIDWITVAETVPIAAALVLLGALGALPMEGIVLALALGGAMLGFAPFNRPPATLFLGDVGSLPIGLLLAWLLFLLAGSGHAAAALLLPLYYLADATLTLLRRIARGERVWEAHRSHAYQRAVDGGMPVMAVIARVFGVNVALAALALVSVLRPDLPTQAACLALGGALVAWLLWKLGRRT